MCNTVIIDSISEDMEILSMEKRGQIVGDSMVKNEVYVSRRRNARFGDFLLEATLVLIVFF